MINRVLIRIKVVQLLYSYMLQEKNFMLESQPASPTKEKRFAFSLYLDTLVLMIRLAENITGRGGEHKLYETRFISNVRSDEKIRNLLHRYKIEDFSFESVIPSLTEEIKESGAYKLFIKKDFSEENYDVSFWKDVFNTIILRNRLYNVLIEKRDNFSIRGVERMKESMASTFVNSLSAQGHLPDALKSLKKSMDMARELYFRLLMLPIELTDMRERDIDDNRHKYIVTEEDRNPNMRFVENQFVAELRTNEDFNNFVGKHKISWMPDDETMIRSLLKAIMDSELYKDYMEFPVTDFHLDCEFWRNVFKQIIFSNSSFLETLEDKSVFWNDDIELIGTFLLKTIKRFDDRGSKEAILPMYKDEEDARFGAELFSAVVRDKAVYREYIDRFLNKDSWDSERLAFMDVIVMETALAEILNFPKIPTTVSINEYIEIAKSYSTPKSGQFVHGLLGAIVASLKEEGSLTKE